jgi:hypothetical protein
MLRIISQNNYLHEAFQSFMPRLLDELKFCHRHVCNVAHTLGIKILWQNFQTGIITTKPPPILLLYKMPEYVTLPKKKTKIQISSVEKLAYKYKQKSVL